MVGTYQEPRRMDRKKKPKEGGSESILKSSHLPEKMRSLLAPPLDISLQISSFFSLPKQTLAATLQ